MEKTRTVSDPPPSTTVESGGGYHRIVSSTLPAGIPRNQRIAQPFPLISAADLLGMDVSHTGWVRKEGYGYRSWKSRFMVLHHGCIYYFKDTDSNAPKGKFPLNGYRCYLAPDRERADRYPHVFKLVPDIDELRTYYISSPSKSEMEGWMKSIDADIELYCPSEYDYVDTCDLTIKSNTCPTVPQKIPVVRPRVPGSSNGTLPHSFPSSRCLVGNATPLLPPKPGAIAQQAEINSEEEDMYEPVDGYFDGKEDHYLKVLPDPVADSSTGQHIHIASNRNNTRPLPPVRFNRKLPDWYEYDDSESEEEESDEELDEELYLDLAKQRKKREARSSPGSPKRSDRPIPTPDEDDNVPNSTDNDEVTYVSVVNSKLPEPPRLTPKPPPRKEKKEFDYLPADCLKPDMHKNQAKVFLELGRTVGVYIVNASQSSDTKMSLSVWLANGVKHYLIFKRQEKYTLDPSLGPEEHFADLYQLVKYYFTRPLPKSNQRLTAPFASK